MKDKINVAELLKDCPNGMELDCLLRNNPIALAGVTDDGSPYPIRAVAKDGFFHVFTKYGTSYNHDDAKCVIFPKGKTTWEGFQRPFNDGDIVYTIMDSIAILNNRIREHSAGFYAYCGLFNYGFDFDVIVSPERLATEEEKQKLFQAIKDNGYKWNEKTKTLEKLIQSKFKVGDRIKSVYNKNQYLIKYISDTHYTLEEVEEKFKYIEPIIEDKNWELVPNKFDITTLKQFDKVLVRDCNTDKWNIDFFAYYREDRGDYQCMTFTKNQCIPYEGNEHLLGTTDDCNEYFKTWK